MNSFAGGPKEILSGLRFRAARSMPLSMPKKKKRKKKTNKLVGGNNTSLAEQPAEVYGNNRGIAPCGLPIQAAHPQLRF
jgi:hypothetical protein